MSTTQTGRDRAPIIDTTDTEQREAGRALVIEALQEAHAVEAALVTNLKAHISMTPSGRYRSLLERHLTETQQQARAIQRRLDDLGASKSIVSQVTGLVETVIGQALILTKGPLDLVRGGSGEEKLLRNARDEAASEVVEIAIYDALERLAEDTGDTETAELARRHRQQEERTLEQLREQIGVLADRLVLERVQGIASFDVSTTGAAEALRRVRGEVVSRAEDLREDAEEAFDDAEDAVEDAAEEVRGRFARAGTPSEDELPIKGYESKTAGEVVSKLPDLSQEELAQVLAYEQANRSRSTITGRIEALQGDEPFEGFDELNGRQIVSRLKDADQATVRKVRDYEQQHRRRVEVLEATQRELSSK